MNRRSFLKRIIAGACAVAVSHRLASVPVLPDFEQLDVEAFGDSDVSPITYQDLVNLKNALDPSYRHDTIIFENDYSDMILKIMERGS